MEKQVTLQRQIRCVERELNFRRRIYERRVQENKMSQSHADDEINAMEAVLATLESVARRQPEMD
jgi:hypothetical protein